MAVALDQKYFNLGDKSSGQDNKIPALHPRWKKSLNFVRYSAPPFDLSDRAAIEEWTEQMTFIEEDLHQLLKMKHDQFWCQVIFDEKLQRLLDSYLRYAPRSYDVVFTLPPRVRDLHDKIHRLIFMTYLRMSTHKESKENFLTPSVFGEILYDNFLLDMAKILDLCVLYGKSNRALLTKMINNVFVQQPKYKDDLRNTVPTIIQVFENIMTKCGIKPGSGNESPIKLEAGKSPLLSMKTNQFQDVIFYLCDTAHTLLSFIEIYPEAASILEEFDLTHRIATAYEQLVPTIHDAFVKRDWEGTSILPLLKQKLREAQLCLLKTYRNIINHLYLQPLLDNSGNKEALVHHIEDFISAMSANLSDRRFLAHHETLYPLNDDLDLINQTGVTIDETRLHFLRDAVSESFALYGRRTEPEVSVDEITETVENVQINGLEDMNTTDGMNDYAATGDEDISLGACAQRVTGIELDSLICNVKDLLPDLGDGFVELCLEECDYSVERVINCILEDKLPLSLRDIDRNMERTKPTSPPPKQENLKAMLSHRHNVFDNDEFDVFNNPNVDMSKVHKGKKDENLRNFMNDKSELKNLKYLYDRYGNEDRPSMYENNGIDEYDDEYDDTYDTNEVGAEDADSADELVTRRPFTVPRVLGGGRYDKATEDDDEDEDDEETEEQRKKRNYQNFLEDPAVLRERQAQRNATRGRGGHRGRGAHRGQDQEEKKTYDVKGTGQKGQGQSSEVQRNRLYKDKHKAQKGNHNRRALADKKRRT